VGGLSITGLQIDSVPLIWADTGAFTGALTNFSNVDFGAYDTTATQFTVVNVGASNSYSMPGLTWSTSPQLSVGYYMKAEDSDTGDVNDLAVDLGIVIAPESNSTDFGNRLLEVSPATISFLWFGG
jgi:hypothetical protein